MSESDAKGQDNQGTELDRLRAENHRLRGEIVEWEERYPCDGLCSDYPEEDCSRHGRKPADLWGIILGLRAEVERLEDALDRSISDNEALRAGLEKDSTIKALRAQLAERDKLRHNLDPTKA
jgi:hypothetical protein